MGFFTAYYDDGDRKIHNAEYGSRVYLHEERHKFQHEKDIFSQFYGCLFYLLFPIVFLTAIDIKYSVLFIVVYGIFYLYLEIDAYVYAFRYYIKRKIYKQ